MRQSDGTKKRRGLKFSDFLIPVILILTAVFFCYQLPSSTEEDIDITASTVRRTALSKGSVSETSYFLDNLNWIKSSFSLTRGMKKFYQYTGVQPFIYFTDNIDGKTQPTDADVQPFAEGLYSELFTDQAHLLVIFFANNGYYNTWYYAGAEAESVVDNEAKAIISDYVDKYHKYATMSNETALSTAFERAARRMMAIQTSPGVYAVIILFSILLSGVYLCWMAFRPVQHEPAGQQTDSGKEDEEDEEYEDDEYEEDDDEYEEDETN